MGKRLQIHASTIDEKTLSQINDIVDSPAFTDRYIAIMPDVHPGAGCVIGFTAEMGDAVCPNVIGVDIGCGVLSIRIPRGGNGTIDFEAVDKLLRDRIPLGMKQKDMQNEKNQPVGRVRELCDIAKQFYDENGIGRFIDPASQIGTLGGGNHFIEIDKSKNGDLWYTVHSGSRNFGKRVADFYQAKAAAWCKGNGIETTKGLEFLPLDQGGSEYLRWLMIAQEYALLNRKAMVMSVFDGNVLPLIDDDYFGQNVVESVHNYIGVDNIVRKGAISAHKGERVVIPLNMADGIVFGRGKGNESYNCSAPHGAGRTGSRADMRKKLAAKDITMDQFRDKMSGIFSTSISERTIDESPMAYKSFEDIEAFLKETVDIEEILVPVYNLKSDELSPREIKKLKKMQGKGESI